MANALSKMRDRLHVVTANITASAMPATSPAPVSPAQPHAAVVALQRNAAGGGRPLVTVPLKARMQFFRQLATLIKSGVSVGGAFEHLKRESTHPMLVETAAKGQICAERGGKLSAWMNTRPQVFSKREATLTMVGEMSGSLDIVFAQLAQDLEDDMKLKRSLFLATFLAKYFVLPLLLLVPGISKVLINGFNALPHGGTGMSPNEQGSAVLRAGLRQYGIDLMHRLVPIAIIGGLVWLAWRVFITTAAGRQVRDRIALLIPATGALWRDIAISRYLGALSLLSETGMTSPVALESCVGIADNVVLDAKMAWAAQLARENTLSITDSLTQVNLLSPTALSLMRTGEHTGSLPEMLNKVSEYYESSVATRRVVIPKAAGITCLFVAGIATAIVVGLGAVSVFNGMFTVAETIGNGG